MISSLALTNFRSYKSASFELEPGVNIVVGPNASGKTNLLEAVIVMARGSSYRAKDVDLVKHKAAWARLEGQFDEGQRVLKLQKIQDNVQKSFKLGSTDKKRLNFEQSLPLVYFEPNHLLAITTGPDSRRAYVDELLERLKPDFKRTMSAYRRALAQRNTLIKQGPNRAASQLFAWDVRLGELGSQVATARAELINEVNKRLPRVYSRIAGKKSKCQINYLADFPIEGYATRLVSALGKTAQRDFERGFTGLGPHREDFAVLLNDQPIAASASRGETRTLLLALKKIELELIEKARNQKPVFLLDDVFSELDGKRRKALVEVIKDYQALITTTDADAAIELFKKRINLIAI